MADANANAKMVLAERVRKECIAAAQQGYENAALSGLCGEGAFEAAISAIQLIDLEALVRQHHM